MSRSYYRTHASSMTPWVIWMAGQLSGYRGKAGDEHMLAEKTLIWEQHKNSTCMALPSLFTYLKKSTYWFSIGKIVSFFDSWTYQRSNVMEVRGWHFWRTGEGNRSRSTQIYTNRRCNWKNLPMAKIRDDAGGKVRGYWL